MGAPCCPRAAVAVRGPGKQEQPAGESLGLLLSRLQEAAAADTVAARQERRIYDITNVLEEINVTEKKSKNREVWALAAPLRKSWRDGETSAPRSRTWISRSRGRRRASEM